MRIYDNGGKTIDRFTIFLDQTDDCIGSSANPTHPQGFWQHTTGIRGTHLGKVIKFRDLPDEVKRQIEAIS